MNYCSHSTHTHMHCGDTFAIILLTRGITNHVVHILYSHFAPYQGSLSIYAAMVVTATATSTLNTKGGLYATFNMFIHT